jgi:hypothetical protein
MRPRGSMLPRRRGLSPRMGLLRDSRLVSGSLHTCITVRLLSYRMQSHDCTQSHAKCPIDMKHDRPHYQRLTTALECLGVA